MLKSSGRSTGFEKEGIYIKATIFIQQHNEEFWINLENKSGWVNMVIDALKEEYRKDRAIEENYDPTASIIDPYKDLPPEDRPIY